MLEWNDYIEQLLSRESKPLTGLVCLLMITIKLLGSLRLLRQVC